MKILHVLSDNTPPTAAEVITGLATQGIEQHISLPKNSRHARKLGKTGIAITFQSFSLARKWMLRRLIKRENPDIVHFWTASAAALIGTATNDQKCVFTGWAQHEADADHFKHCVKIALSGLDIELALSKKDSSSKRAIFIPAPKEIAALPPVNRSTMSTPREAKVLLCFTKAHPYKGLNELLEALHKLPQCIVWLEGSPSSRHEQEAAARKFNVIDRVRFLGRRHDHTALLRSADICVFPESGDPYPPATEAWSSGTPLITLDTAIASRIIDNGNTGILTPEKNAVALTEAISNLLSDDPLRRRLVAQGYASYVKDYSPEAALRKWKNFFKSAQQ